MMQRFSGDHPELEAGRRVQAPPSGGEFSPREQAWLRYQRWRYQRGLLTEFPGDAVSAGTARPGTAARPTDRPG